MLHIFFAVVWVGGGTVIAILAFMLSRERDPVQIGWSPTWRRSPSAAKRRRR
jgi:hypothetical protein